LSKAFCYFPNVRIRKNALNKEVVAVPLVNTLLTCQSLQHQCVYRSS